jgi:hypothetical protein
MKDTILSFPAVVDWSEGYSLLVVVDQYEGYSLLVVVDHYKDIVYWMKSIS